MPSAIEFAAIVVDIVTSPKFVIVPLPVTSPLKVIVGSATSKSKVPSPDSKVTDMPDSVLLDTIAPTIACILLEFTVTEPLLTVKSVLSKEAIPLLLAVASSPLNVTVPDDSATSKPSPAANVIVPPNAVAVLLLPSVTVIVELASFAFAILPANIVFVTVPLSPVPIRFPVDVGRVRVTFPENALCAAACNLA